MGELMILAIVENDEPIFSDLKRYLQAKTMDVNANFKRDMALSFPCLKIDLYRREVKINDKLIRLTDLEFRILQYLASQPERIFTYQQIYENVWNEEYACEKGNIMSHICHIRKKLESEDGKDCQYIENIRGIGYRFNKL